MHLPYWFIDLQMPRVDGLEATRVIRELERGAPSTTLQMNPPASDRRRRPVPIVALTASAMTEDRAVCLVAGMDDYLAKPFTADGLATLARKWLTPLSI